MLIDERRFSFIPSKKWKNLSKEDEKSLRSYRSNYGHYKRTMDEIEELEKQIKIKKEKKENYLTKMKRLNYEIDHLRTDYHFSWSVSKLSKKDYYNFTISRRGHNPKNGTLGSPKLIEGRLTEYYKKNTEKLDYLKNRGWKQFLIREVNDNNSKVRNFIIDSITKDPTLKKIPMNRKILFPLPKDKKELKSKGVSIPIMITNKMRMELSTLGYSREEMKHLTPIESHKIIDKGVPKRPSIDRSRNQ